MAMLSVAPEAKGLTKHRMPPTSREKAMISSRVRCFLKISALNKGKLLRARFSMTVLHFILCRVVID